MALQQIPELIVAQSLFKFTNSVLALKNTTSIFHEVSYVDFPPVSITNIGFMGSLFQAIILRLQKLISLKFKAHELQPLKMKMSIHVHVLDKPVSPPQRHGDPISPDIRKTNAHRIAILWLR